MKRVVIGPRANGDVGVFVSPPGVDADTAADSALKLSITSKFSMLLLLGRVAAGSHNIALGLGRSPYVQITSQWTFVGISGTGPYRPSPVAGATNASCTIVGNGASMTIAAPYSLVYEVYAQAFT